MSCSSSCAATQKYRTTGSLKGTTVLLGTDETYMAALSADEKLLKHFGAAQRVTGGSKACFEALRPGRAPPSWPTARRSLITRTDRLAARAGLCAGGFRVMAALFSPRFAKGFPLLRQLCYTDCVRACRTGGNFFTVRGQKHRYAYVEQQQ